METLTLVDGTVLNGTVIQSGDDRMLFVYLDGLSLAEGYGYFSDKRNIQTLIVMNRGNEYIYEGYTEITAINTEYGNCNLTMRRNT